SALPQSDGSYRLKAPWLKRAGHVDLVFTVVAGEDVDDLPLALDIPTADQAAASGGEASHQPSWLAQIRAYVTPGILIPLGGGLLAGWLLGRLSRRKRVASS